MQSLIPFSITVILCFQMIKEMKNQSTSHHICHVEPERLQDYVWEEPFLTPISIIHKLCQGVYGRLIPMNYNRNLSSEYATSLNIILWLIKLLIDIIDFIPLCIYQYRSKLEVTYL